MGLVDVWSLLWRAALALVFVLFAGIASFLTGLGAQPLSWLLAPVSLAAFGAGLAWLTWLGRSPRERFVAVAIATSVATMLGVVVWAASPAGPRVLARQIEQIELPAGARLVDEHHSGNVLCFDYCPSVSRTYRVEGDPQQIADRMERSLEASGSRAARIAPGETLFATGTDGDFHLTVDIGPAYRHPVSEHHPDPEPIPGVTEITITVTAQQPF